MDKKILIVGMIALILMIGLMFSTNIGMLKNKTEEVQDNIPKTVKENYSFYGRVVESRTNYIIVEPNENEEIRKSSDKISIGLGEDNDAFYMVGTNVKITYDGTIMETYPAQVKAIKIEIKSADQFEIIFYDKQPQTDIKAHKIIDKNETDKYDYDVYVYEGSANIVIDGETYSLRNALLENKITMNEIIAQANYDLSIEKIKGDMYKDGGTMEYQYEGYTIIKYHTLNGNRDVYICPANTTLHDLN